MMKAKDYEQTEGLRLTPDPRASNMEDVPKPPWLKKRIPLGSNIQKVSALLEEARLHTVCQEARCPNLPECFSGRTATFMIMGNICTRNCRFCAVSHGTPAPLDEDEPKRVASTAEQMGLRYVVITSVTRKPSRPLRERDLRC
jgi:lipoic acid synthetase